MNKTGNFLEKWNEQYDKVRPGLEKMGSVWGKIWHVIYMIGLWIYRLRAFFMAIPVVYAAVKLARVSYEMLPDMVGLNLLANGSFSYMVTKETAVYGPLVITLGCLLMSIFSRKTLYPWLISIFSLVLPIVLLITNAFPL